MELQTTTHSIVEALTRIKVNMDDARNTYPYITLLADEPDGSGAQQGAVFATDTVAFIESRFEATVVKPGVCQVDKKFVQILANMPDELVTMKLDGSRVRLQTQSGIKARLQIVDRPPVPYQVVRQKLAEAHYDFAGSLNKADLMALVRMSKILPEAEDGSSPYKAVVLKIDGERVIGSSQFSSVGAVEEMPVRIENFVTLSENPITIIVDTTYFEPVLNICTDRVYMQASGSPSVPLMLGDPDIPSWVGMLAKLNLRSNQT